jgi:hypothetical protein
MVVLLSSDLDMELHIVNCYGPYLGDQEQFWENSLHLPASKTGTHYNWGRFKIHTKSL